MKHEKEMIKWAKSPDNTAVWYNTKTADGWERIFAPGWHSEYVYVIDDEYANLRKAGSDGKEILFNANFGTKGPAKWTILNSNEAGWDFPLEAYKIKVNTMTSTLEFRYPGATQENECSFADLPIILKNISWELCWSLTVKDVPVDIEDEMLRYIFNTQEIWDKKQENKKYEDIIYG